MLAHSSSSSSTPVVAKPSSSSPAVTRVQLIAPMRAERGVAMVHLFSGGARLQCRLSPDSDAALMTPSQSGPLSRRGPLGDVRIVEFAAIGPVPFAAMLLSDLGAEVIRIDRKPRRSPRNTEVYLRGRRAIALDLKNARAGEVALKLVEKSDALLEGFRPGVMERLGL